MAAPVAVKLTCPCCSVVFQTRSMGATYHISGVETDLRETGSIEEVRRYAVASCPQCAYSDYTHSFPDGEGQSPEGEALTEEERGALREALGEYAGAVALDLDRFRLAAMCFQVRGLDFASRAELALLGYYVARDLGRRDVEPQLREEAVSLLEETLEEEELPGPLVLRYAYLLGELNRRAGQREAAVRAFGRAVSAGRAEAEVEESPGLRSGIDLGRLAERMLLRVQEAEAPADQLRALTQGSDPLAASEARRVLAGRRDRASVEAAIAAYGEASPGERTAMLRELRPDPPKACAGVFMEALGSASPEDVRLAAGALGELGDPDSREPLLEALGRGVLSTEQVLVEALKQVADAETCARVGEILAGWEARDGGQDAWDFAADPAPLRYLLYTSGEPQGLELLIRDMKRLEEHDLWDKVPAGGPVSAALTLGTPEVVLAFRGLLTAKSPAARRWAAYCLAAFEATEAREDLEARLDDPDVVVRLQVANALAQLGDPSHEGVVLEGVRSLGDNDAPFALHFLIPFQSEAVKAFLLEAYRGNVANPGEVLPLLGRQEVDDEIRGLLLSALLDTNDDTRAGGVTGLAFSGEDGAAERLRLLFDIDDSGEVRRRIVFGLGHLAQRGQDAEATVAFLRERLNRGTPRLRFSIGLTLLQQGDPSGVDLVRERAALFEESFERYDLVAPALKALAAYDRWP